MKRITRRDLRANLATHLAAAAAGEPFVVTTRGGPDVEVRRVEAVTVGIDRGEGRSYAVAVGWTNRIVDGPPLGSGWHDPKMQAAMRDALDHVRGTPPGYVVLDVHAAQPSAWGMRPPGRMRGYLTTDQYGVVWETKLGRAIAEPPTTIGDLARKDFDPSALDRWAAGCFADLRARQLKGTIIDDPYQEPPRAGSIADVVARWRKADGDAPQLHRTATEVLIAEQHASRAFAAEYQQQPMPAPFVATVAGTYSVRFTATGAGSVSVHPSGRELCRFFDTARIPRGVFVEHLDAGDAVLTTNGITITRLDLVIADAPDTYLPGEAAARADAPKRKRTRSPR